MLYLSFICNFRLVGGSVVHFQLVANWHCLVVWQLIQYSVTRVKRHRTSLFPILLSLLLIVWSNPPYCHYPTNKTSWPPWTGQKPFFERFLPPQHFVLFTKKIIHRCPVITCKNNWKTNHNSTIQEPNQPMASK